MSEGKASETEPPSAGAPRRPPPWRRRLAVAAGVLAVLVVAFRVALPYALERAVPMAAERFGFAAELANVDFALLRGHVTLEGLRVAPLAAPGAAGETPDLFRLGRLFVNLEWLALLSGEIEVAELVVEKPELALVRAPDGTLELPALPPPEAVEAPSEAPIEPAAEPEPGKPWPVRLDSLVVRDTGFRLVDGGGGADLVDFQLAELGLDDLRLLGSQVGLGDIRIAEPRLRVRREVLGTSVGHSEASGAAPTPEAGGSAPPALRIDALAIDRAEFSVLSEGEPVDVALHLKTSDVSFAPDAPFPLDFGLELGEGGSLGLVGRLGLNPLVWDGKVAWQKLAAPLLVRAALPALLPWIQSCAASGDLDVKLGPEGVRASGRLGVDDLAVEDPEKELALGWKRLAIELREAEVPLATPAQPIRVALGTIALEAPTARYVLPNTAVERLLASVQGAPSETAGPAAEPAPEAPAPAPAAGTAPAPEPRITIDAVEVRGGSAEFVDRTDDPPYQGRVRDLTVDVTNVKLPERTVQRLRVRGIAPERAPFDLRLALPGAQGTLSFTLERLPLAQFTPYAAKAADLRIPQGELSIETKARLERSGAAGKVESQVRVHRLAITGGAHAISVAGMPLDLALALLRDPKGDIALPVPLDYGERGASAGLGAIVAGALKAALTGAVTSPLKAVGALLPDGGGAEVSFEPIAFAAGSDEPPAGTAKALAPLARLLGDRPGLGLGLVGSAGPADRPALAERVLIEAVAAGRELPEVRDAGFFARRRIRGALEARGRGEAGPLEADDEALFARYLEAARVPAGRYADLARRRAAAVRTLFESTHGVAPARLAAEAAPEPGPPQVALDLRLGEDPAEAAAAP